MLEALNGAKRRFAGTKQVLRALSSDCVDSVFIAEDADEFLKKQIFDSCKKCDIVPIMAPSMKLLGLACKIDVPTACAAIPKT